MIMSSHEKQPPLLQQEQEQEQQQEQHQQLIKIISEWYVKPKYLNEAITNQPYYLAPADLIMLSIDPIQKGLLFPCSSPNPQTQIPYLVHKLKRSVSHALVHFYPLAGRFDTHKYEEDHTCLVYLDCAKGPGARLIQAVASNLSVSDILSAHDVPLTVRSFFDLGQRSVNHDGHTLPLLSIQVTELLDGVFIGFTMNHSIVDGTTFSHFVTSLSEIFNSPEIDYDDDGDEITKIIPISRGPMYKPFVPDGLGPIFKLPYLEPEEFVTRYDPGPLRESIFHFSSASMAALKSKANQDCKAEIESGTVTGTNQISSFQALSGLVWRSIIRARGSARDQGTTCNLLINARPRLQPPLSNDYFGNFISGANGHCTVEELLGRSLGGAAMILNQQIMANDHKAIQDIWKVIVKNLLVAQPGLAHESIYGPNTVVIGGSPRFDMYGPEFGLGRAVAVRTGYANKDNGKVTANPGCEGGGSVDLEICLKPEAMAALEMDEEFMNFVSL